MLPKRRHSDHEARKNIIIRHLENTFSKCLKLPKVSVNQLEKDFEREKVILNDIVFVPDKRDTFRNSAFIASLELLCERLRTAQHNVHMTRLKSINHELLYDAKSDYIAENIHIAGKRIANAILQRASRTGCGADSYFFVQKLFNVEDVTMVTQRVDTSDPPIYVSVFLKEGSPENRYVDGGKLVLGGDNLPIPYLGPEICCKIEVYNNFNISDIGNLEEYYEGSVLSAWLKVSTVMVDEINFSTDEYKRYLSIQVATQYGRGSRLVTDAIDDIEADHALVNGQIKRMDELELLSSPPFPLSSKKSSTPRKSFIIPNHLSSFRKQELQTELRSIGASEDNESSRFSTPIKDVVNSQDEGVQTFIEMISDGITAGELAISDVGTALPAIDAQDAGDFGKKELSGPILSSTPVKRVRSVKIYYDCY